MKKSEFPFRSDFSLVKLMEFWEKKANESPDGCERDYASSLVNKVKSIPELNGIIEDYTVLEKNRLLIDGLISAIFPSAYLNTNLQAISLPGKFQAIYSTQRFKDLFCNEDGDFGFDMNLDSKTFENGKMSSFYAFVLMEYYKIKMFSQYPLIRKIIDHETGLERFFKINLDNRFVKVKLNGVLPLLTKDQITYLSENMLSYDLWEEIIPPNQFEFEGFLVVNMFEVTEQEAISALKQDLLRKDVFKTEEGFSGIEHKIRTLFRNPRLRLGMVSISDESGRLINAGHKIGNSFLMNEQCVSCCKDYRGSIYERALETNEPQIIHDLDNLSKCSPVDQAVAVQGIKNLLVAGLKTETKNIGMLELASSVPGDLNALNAVKIMDVLPLFTLALQRSIEDIEAQVQSIIKEKCTAVHPSVEWRFRQAAFNLLEKEKSDVYADMEEIIFKDAYPIYALSDIRNSSIIRNNAITSDLKHILLLARNVVNEAFKHKEMPVLELLNYRIEEKILSLDAGLHTGDETSIISFLKREIESLFPKVEHFGKNVSSAIAEYKNSLDPELGFYYNKRKEYEESVYILNESIAAYVDEEEEKAQSIFPHYFEKYKTDGIEYTIFIGDEIAEKGGFDEFYLKNIRLWQLLMMCNIARKANELKSSLSVELELAHLILVQNNPLSIRFHYDQKKFDVDGTYNVHYEILKKRIDKAELKGKEERLTQPGKLAIVYSQPGEANEYRQYIDYLQSKGYLEDGVEELEVKDLQGVYGLRALRVGVNLAPKKLAKEIDIQSVIKQLEKTTK